MTSSYTATTLVADYTHDSSGVAAQKLEVYSAGDGASLACLVYIPDTGETFDGTLTSARDGIAFLARAAGITVAKVSFRQTGNFAVYPEPEEDVAQAIQHLRLNASGYSIDSDRIGVYGVRRGANAGAWSALGPDLADGGGSAQEQLSTRVAAVLLRNCVTYWQAMKQATTLATDFSATSSDRLTDVLTATQDAASPALYGDIAANATMPAFLVHTAAAVSADTTSPFPTDVETDLGSVWHGDAMLGELSSQGATYHSDRSRVRGLAADTNVPSEIDTEALEWLLWQLGMLPVEELVLRAVEDKLRTISHANGYGTDVQRVFRFEDWDRNARAFPSIMAASVDDSFDENSFATKEEGTFRIGLALLNLGWQRQTTRASIFIADVRKALNDDAYWEARATASRLGIGAPWLVHVMEGRRFTDIVDEQERSGATLVVKLGFREERGDPYTELP